MHVFPNVIFNGSYLIFAHSTSHTMSFNNWVGARIRRVGDCDHLTYFLVIVMIGFGSHHVENVLSQVD